METRHPQSVDVAQPHAAPCLQAANPRNPLRIPGVQCNVRARLGRRITVHLLVALLLTFVVSNSALAAPLGQDVTPPNLVSSTPADGATDVAVDTTLVFTFDEAVFVFEGDITLECPQGSATAFAVSGDGTDTITLTPNSALPAATTCTWTLVSVADFDFNEINPPVSGSFTTAGGVQDTAPTVVSITPADQATNVAANSTIVLQLSEAVDVGENAFTLACPQGTAIPFQVAGSGTATITITPDANLPADTTCVFTVNGQAITDRDGNPDPLATQTVTSQFTTAGNTNPGTISLTSVSPTDQATDVAIDSKITLQFSAAVFAYSGSFTLACPTGTAIPFTVTPEWTPVTTITLAPSANLPAGVTCTWQTVGAELYDASFNATNLQASGSFTTKAGGTDPDPDPGDSSIVRIEVNQALGVQINSELNFVAGKPTVIRAFLKEATTINAQQTSVKILRDGNEVTTLQPKNTDRVESVVDFLCPNLDACGRWAAGKYTFEVTVNGATRSTAGTIYDFKKRNGLRILAVAVRTTYGTEARSVTDNRWRTGYQFVSKVYPIAPSDVTWVIGAELDATAHNVNSNDGQRGIWQLLANLQPNNCRPKEQAGPNDTVCYDKIIGFIPDNPVINGRTLAGYTYGHPANIVVSTDGDMEATVAHEIGHNYGLGDTYNGGSFACGINPPPAQFGCGNTGKTKGRGDGTNIPANHNPYDVTERGRLPDMTSYMGGGGALSLFWTTQEAYGVIFRALAPTANGATTLRDAFLDVVASVSIAPVRVIDFFGYIGQDDQIFFEPSYVDSSETRIRSTTGTYSAVAVDAGGNVLASQALDITFNLEITGENGREYVTYPEVPFGGIMEFPDGATELQIRKNGTVLATQSVSANAPTIQLTAPTAGATLDGEFTITWTANDADGDDLTYIVEYTPDATNPDADWYVLAADLSETSWVDDFSTLPGGDHAQLVVTASDGVLSTEAVSAEFTVPAQAPDLYIFEPEGGYAYAVGDDVILEADAYDPQLGQFIPDAQIVWRSDIDGELGTGAILVTKGLSEGTHLVSAEATDSNGATVSDEIELYVGNVSSQYIPQSTTDNTTVENNFLGRNVQLTVPAALSTNDAYVDLYAYQTPISETPPNGFLFADRFFAIFVDELVNEEWQSITTSDAGIILTVSYSELPDNINPETLRIHRYVEETDSWVDAATECNPNSVYDRSTPGKLSVQLCHFSEYALTSAIDGGSGGNTAIYLPLIQR